MSKPDAEPALTALQPLLGEWKLEARGPDGTTWPGDAHATFEWHDSGAHLVQRTTIDTPGAPDSVAIIGCDGANGSYVQLYSDDRGVCRMYEMHIDGDTWTLSRQGAPFPQRFVATISQDGDTISGRWDKAEDGATFTTDFFLTYRRIAAAEA